MVFSGALLASNLQCKQNLTNLNYLYVYFSIIYVWTHLKTTFSDLNEEKKIPEKIWEYTKKHVILVFIGNIWSLDLDSLNPQFSRFHSN